jgi:tetratricopeptide (TPR) repeat protein
MMLKIFIMTLLTGWTCYHVNVSGQEKGDSFLPKDNNEQNNKIFATSEYAFGYLTSGMEYDKAGDYEIAVEMYSHAIELNPAYAEAYDKRGISFTKMLMYRKALKDFNKAVELKENYAEAYNHRGIIYYCMGEFWKSIAEYNKAIEIDPSIAKAYFNRGIVKLVTDDEPGALLDMKMAADLKDKDASDYLSTNNIDTN